MNFTLPLLLLAILIESCNPNTNTLVPEEFGEIPISFAKSSKGYVLFTTIINSRDKTGKAITNIRRQDESNILSSIPGPEGAVAISATEFSGEIILLYETDNRKWTVENYQAQKQWDLQYFPTFGYPQVSLAQITDSTFLTFPYFASYHEQEVPIYISNPGSNSFSNDLVVAGFCSLVDCYNLKKNSNTINLNSSFYSVPISTVSTPGWLDSGKLTFVCPNTTNTNKFGVVSGNAFFAVNITEQSIVVEKVSDSFLKILSEGGSGRIDCIDPENAVLLQQSGEAKIINILTGEYEELPIRFKAPSLGNFGAVAIEANGHLYVAYAVVQEMKVKCEPGVICVRRHFSTRLLNFDRARNEVISDTLLND